jgi:hypothetical protein
LQSTPWKPESNDCIEEEEEEEEETECAMETVENSSMETNRSLDTTITTPGGEGSRTSVVDVNESISEKSKNAGGNKSDCKTSEVKGPTMPPEGDKSDHMTSKSEDKTLPLVKGPAMPPPELRGEGYDVTAVSALENKKAEKQRKMKPPPMVWMRILYILLVGMTVFHLFTN